jgi:hypothetical protein
MRIEMKNILNDTRKKSEKLFSHYCFDGIPKRIAIFFF